MRGSKYGLRSQAVQVPVPALTVPSRHFSLPSCPQLWLTCVAMPRVLRAMSNAGKTQCIPGYQHKERGGAPYHES